VGAPDTDILAAAIEILRKKIAAGTANFLVREQAHRRNHEDERVSNAITALLLEE